jgi:hypothetical protein
MDSSPLLKNDLDTILNRIGIGKYHLYAFITIFLAILGDGCSMTIYGLLAPILQKI